MLEDVLHPPQQLPTDDMSSLLSAQLLELCDPELFSESIQNSEITSCSNCCYEEYPDSSKFSLPEDSQDLGYLLQEDHGINTNMTPTTTASNTTTVAIANYNRNETAIFDQQEDVDNDISASIDFSPSPPFSVSPFVCPQQDHLMMDFPSVQLTENQLPLTNSTDGLSNFTRKTMSPLIGPPLIASVFKEDCLSSMPPYIPLDPASPSCSFIGPMSMYLPGNMTGTLYADRSGIFSGSFLIKADLQARHRDYKCDNNGGIFCSDPTQVPMPEDMQAFCAESQKLMDGNSSSAPFATDISNLEDPTYKVGKLSVEQRKEKIHRYMKKRNERNFSKKIKYACRKTLADSRPRVRGRFAKNDEFEENSRLACGHLEDNEKEEVAVKEDDMMDASDIFAHISGVNSFNYSIQSWI
ncbi:uncharacterized protein LOC115726853 [Rhodamnia argentea]|uniref:Uncharacterized protein LOC115726853 n=1 Tax=Rhodamnia argentea TaxID=178133 RepID=A0ABM3GVK6_9MYRT|nr:uncharacterized protein LOC115726853 [Rhodamnia argentea]